MRRRALLAAICLLGAVAVSTAFSRSGGPERGRLEGSWQYTFVGHPELDDIKILNQDRWVWSVFVRDTGELLASAGGTYTLRGNRYHETVEYASPGYGGLLGKTQAFQITLHRNQWHLSGTLTNGAVVDETWTRIR